MYTPWRKWCASPHTKIATQRPTCQRRAVLHPPCRPPGGDPYTRRVTDFLVRRDDLRIYQISDGEEALASTAEGTLQFRVERFGLTANNLTYGVFGDSFGYWQFFPAPEGWGRIPVWGFGEVNVSGVDGIVPGDRFYGYWPMSSYVTVQASADRAGFVESSAARTPLPSFYNHYLRAVPEAGFEPSHDDASVVMRPLFLTAWLIADQLAANGWHGAEAVVLASASSKTAYATAWAIGEHDDSPRLIGLTSASNLEFTEGLGVYDDVLTYDDIGALPADRGIVLIDMTGNAGVRREVHEVTRNVLQASIMVGATHWEGATLVGDSLPGPEPVFFFAPTVGDERAAALGPAVFAQRIGAAWKAFADRLPALIEIEHATGADALATAYAGFVEGTADPRKGLVFTL
jgi:hypothetical protein